MDDLNRRLQKIIQTLEAEKKEEELRKSNPKKKASASKSVGKTGNESKLATQKALNVFFFTKKNKKKSK